MDAKKLYLNYLTATLNKKCKTTRKHIDQYRPVFANNRNSAGFSANMKELIFTMTIREAAGAHFRDADGNDYIDMSMGFGVHLFGHRPDFIEQALKNQIERGVTLGPIYEDAAIVAQLIHDLTGQDRTAFYNSGTEAVMVAMRLARAATGKNKVVIFEGSYHGTHDSLLGIKTDEETHALLSTVPGVTQSAVNDTLLLQYGQESSLAIIRKLSGEIAAVLVEPVMSRHPELKNEAFLIALRTLCTETGIALIFDEVITGFRTANGGAAALFQIEPDIATYGKIAGGGLPIGIVAGKRRFIDMIDGGTWQFGDDSEPKSRQTFTAGTFNHHPLAMAAARSVLQLLKDMQGVIQEELNKRTAEMCESLNLFYREQGYPFSMVFFSSLFRFLLKGNAKLLFYALLKENVYIWEGRNCFLSTAHTARDLQFFTEKVKQCCFELEAAGLIHGKRVNSVMTRSTSICAGIRINKELNIDKLAFACRYLFLAIPKLRRCNCSVSELENPGEVKENEEAIFIVYISTNHESTFINVSTERQICDGWSLILFFKALSRTYNALHQSLPLPGIDYEDEFALPNRKHCKNNRPALKAAVLHSKISLASLDTIKTKRLFPFLLSRFKKTIEQEKSHFNFCTCKIAVPAAGQLHYRRVKAFGQMTLHKEISFAGLMNNNVVDELDWIDRQIKSHSEDIVEENNNAPAEILFNFDNLDFALEFEGEAAIFQPVDEPETMYPLVCNITKLDAELVISIKYAINTIQEQQVKKLLASYINCLHENI